MSDTYLTLAEDTRAEIKVKGSRFLAEAFGMDRESAAQSQIEAVRQREHAATHHCFAYRLGVQGDLFRYDDDGEPSGTAGRPILRQIEGRDLVNVLLVVTRYYGGTKLGMGGLARAYGDAAAEALASGGVTEHVQRMRLRLRFGYDDTRPARRVLAHFDANIAEEQYTDTTEWTVGVRQSQVANFRQAFVEALGGRGTVDELNQDPPDKS